MLLRIVFQFWNMLGHHPCEITVYGEHTIEQGCESFFSCTRQMSESRNKFLSFFYIAADLTLFA